VEVLTLACRAETLLGVTTLGQERAELPPEEETLLNSDAKSTSSTEYENS
jgi:hypothetical protein